MLKEDVEGMIIGGLAASLLGRPRFTNDSERVYGYSGMPKIYQKIESLLK